MALFHIPLDRITEQNLLDLINAKAAETEVHLHALAIDEHTPRNSLL